MQTYIGNKIINATPMTRGAYNALRGWATPADENPDDAGYLVEYRDGGKPNVPGYAGYVSWSPTDVFERAYKPTSAMTFGDAIIMLKQGCKVARAGWNGKGMWLEIQFPDEHSKMTLPYVFLNYPADATNTPGARVPWLASQTDMLAEDWTLVE